MTRTDLPPIGYAGRADALRSRLAEAGLDGLVLTDHVSVRWVTGFTGSNGAVAVLPHRVVLVTDNRYRDRAAEELAAAGVDVEVVIGVTQAEQQSLLVAAFAGCSTVGAQAASISHARWNELGALLPLTAADGHVADLRRVKDPGEIARIRAACACADAALAEVAPTLGDGVSESDVARRAGVPHAASRRRRPELCDDRRERSRPRRPAAPRDRPPHDRRG